jgi:hypothetical protein
MSARSNGKPLWWVRPMNGMTIDEGKGHVFAGTDDEMEAHIRALHRETGKQHAATSVQ